MEYLGKKMNLCNYIIVLSPFTETSFIFMEEKNENISVKYPILIPPFLVKKILLTEIFNEYSSSISYSGDHSLTKSYPAGLFLI